MLVTSYHVIVPYQFSGHDMPLQNQAGWPFWFPFRNVDFFRHMTMHRITNSGKPQVKITLVFSKHKFNFLEFWNIFSYSAILFGNKKLMKSFCEYFVTDSFSFLQWETAHTQMCGILTYWVGYIAQECPLLSLSVLRDQLQTQDVVTMLATRNDLKHDTIILLIFKFI